jgi:tRNA threonylcarbamoyladenosine biosynthesis protein TsaE
VNEPVSDPAFDLSEASPGDAPGMVEVIHAAFGARPALVPPSTAIDETADSVRQALAAGGGIYATVAGAPAGSIIVGAAGPPGVATLQRVSVHPDQQRHGIASAMVAAAERLASRLGYRRLELFARGELPELIRFWQHRGFVVVREQEHGVILGRPLGVLVDVPTADAMHRLGTELAERLDAGDLIIASGELGAGKTTLAQGLGAGLGSDGVIISPTFVISRVHPSRTGRPTLVHVDAYRLTSPAELDDLDLDASLPSSITLVEWGSGLAEELAGHRLEIDIRRSTDPDDDTRTVMITGVGDRWVDVDLSTLTGVGTRTGAPA